MELIKKEGFWVNDEGHVWLGSYLGVPYILEHEDEYRFCIDKCRQTSHNCCDCCKYDMDDDIRLALSRNDTIKDK